MPNDVDQTNVDAELSALRQSLEALLPLDENTRQRVLSYLRQRFPCHHHDHDR